MDNILKYSILVFFVQLIFIGCRTWNVKAIAKQNIQQVLISGAFVHMAWLLGITIGAVSMHKIISNFEWKYLPIILCSLLGGLLGSYISMKIKKNDNIIK
jgi:predicted MFS family arabinose efflux permease